jgi:hypothetical protein
MNRRLEAEIVECVMRGNRWFNVAVYLSAEFLPDDSKD